MPGPWKTPPQLPVRIKPEQTSHPIDWMFTPADGAGFTLILQFHDGSGYEYRRSDGAPEELSRALLDAGQNAGDIFNVGMRFNPAVEYRRVTEPDVTGWTVTPIGPETYRDVSGTRVPKMTRPPIRPPFAQAA